MATVRIIVTLKPGILDAQGQAVLQGLHALGYEAVSDVKVGRYLELAVPDAMTPEEINRMCDRFLANPLIEEWRIEAGKAETRNSRSSIVDRRSSANYQSPITNHSGAASHESRVTKGPDPRRAGRRAH